jgi:hypothetical protein
MPSRRKLLKLSTPNNDSAKPLILFFNPARRKRAQRVRERQHIASAIILIATGLEKIFGENPHHLTLAIFQALIGAALIGAIIYEKRHHDKMQKAVVPIVDTLAAAMLAMEGINRAVEGGHLIPYCYFLMAIFTFFFGSYIPIDSLRRHLRLDDNLLYARTGLFKSWQIAWTEISEIIVDINLLRVVSKKNKLFAIDLAKAKDKKEIWDKLSEFAQQKGVTAEQIKLIPQPPPPKT